MKKALYYFSVTIAVISLIVEILGLVGLIYFGLNGNMDLALKSCITFCFGLFFCLLFVNISKVLE